MTELALINSLPEERHVISRICLGEAINPEKHFLPPKNLKLLSMTIQCLLMAPLRVPLQVTLFRAAQTKCTARNLSKMSTRAESINENPQKSFCGPEEHKQVDEAAEQLDGSFR